MEIAKIAIIYLDANPQVIVCFVSHAEPDRLIYYTVISVIAAKIVLAVYDYVTSSTAYITNSTVKKHMNRKLHVS